MRRVVWVVVAVVLAALALVLPASAAPKQASLDEVLTALGIERQPADYVVVVDISRSMLEEGRYDRVRAALTGMMSALGPDDQVSLVTFSDTTSVVYRGTNKQAALAALPVTPTGDWTDIGAGIAAGLGEVSREGASRTAVLALITDGTLATAPGSVYEIPGSPAWVALRAEADALLANKQVAAYAIGLGTGTDAGLLATVFPEATNVSGDRIAEHLAAIDRALLSFRAAERLRPDAAGTVSVQWSELDPTALASSATTNATLTLTSNLTSAPVELNGLALSAEGLDGLTADLPASVTLGPGESQSFPVSLQVQQAGDGGSFWLEGAIESPWQDVVAQVGLTFAPTWSAAAVEVPAAPAPEATPLPAPASMPDLRPWLLGAGALALVALAVVSVRARRKPLSGSILVTNDGVPVREFLLEGASVSLAKAAGPAVPGLSGSVAQGPRADDDSPRIRVSGNLGNDRVRAVLDDGESVRFGDYVLTYTAQRTRTLTMVRSGIEADA